MVDAMINTNSIFNALAMAITAMISAVLGAPETKPHASQPHTAYYGTESATSKVPAVMLSMREDALCKLKIGQQLPAFELPTLDSDAKTKLSKLFGKKATVVVFWNGGNRMTTEELADLGPDVIERFGKEGVEVVGIAVNEKPADAKEALNKAGAKFPNLLDSEGKAFAEVGKEKLPRTFVLGSNGKIVWFDISYTLATRRELHETLRALTGDANRK
jgi:peroxiredoxin